MFSFFFVCFYIFANQTTYFPGKICSDDPGSWTWEGWIWTSGGHSTWHLVWMKTHSREGAGYEPSSAVVGLNKMTIFFVSKSCNDCRSCFSQLKIRTEARSYCFFPHWIHISCINLYTQSMFFQFLLSLPTMLCSSTSYHEVNLTSGGDQDELWRKLQH